MSLWQYLAAVSGWAKLNQPEEDEIEAPTLADLNTAIANSRS